MDNSNFLYSTQASFGGTYDVIVSGGGPSGIAAAIASARGGLKTLLVEAQGCLGGTSTSGILPFWLGCMTGSRPFAKMLEENLKYEDLRKEQRFVVKGIFEELTGRIKQEGFGVGPGEMAQSDRFNRMGCHDEFTFDVEAGKRIFDELVTGAGAEILYFTQVLDTKREGRKIQGLYLVNKSGLSYVEAKAFIDCTGDADIVYRAGFETYKGDRDTGVMNTVSLISHYENINTEKLAGYLENGGDPLFRQYIEEYTKETGSREFGRMIIMFPMMQEGVFMVNAGTGFEMVDGTDAKQISQVMIKGRQRAKNLLEKLFKPRFPGFENARLRLTAAIPGVRETRRIVGEYILTEEDLVMGRDFEDVIGFSGRHFDLGRPVKMDNGTYQSTQPSNHKEIIGGATKIPYRTLIPQNTENIITAGRCISADGQALGTVRIMPACFATGQAAGTAAIQVAGKGVRFIDVDVTELRSTLKKNGAIVD